MGTPKKSPKGRASGAETDLHTPATDEPSPAVPQDLAEALRAIDGAEAEAREDGLPIPSARALADTETLLRQLYEAHPYRYDVYPSVRDEMVIYARPELGRSIMVVRHADGTAWCSVCVPEKNEAISFKREDFVSAKTLRKAVKIMTGQEDHA